MGEGGGGGPMPEGASPVQMPNYLGIRHNLHRHEFGGWGRGGGLQCLKGHISIKWDSSLISEGV